MSELDNIITAIKETYDGNAWHGSSVKSVLSKLKDENLNAKIGNSHSIVELILHMAVWRTFVIKKISDEDNYDVSDEANFPKASSLKNAIQQLDKTQVELISAIKDFDCEKLHQQVPLKNYSYHKMLCGITHHDLYHLGQIVMIAKQF